MGITSHATYPSSYKGVCLVEIYLPDYTLYYSDRNIAVDNELYYARLLENPTIKQSLQAYDRNSPDSDCEIVLSIHTDPTDDSKNPKKYLYNEQYSQTWAGSLIKIYEIEEGEAKANALLVFHGYVQQIGGLNKDLDTLTIYCTGYQPTEKDYACGEKFNFSDYPYMDEELKDKPIPHIFGDFTENWLIPVYCVDTRKDNLSFIASENGIDITGSVLVIRDGEELFYSPDDSTDVTEFGITDYEWKKGDEIWIKCASSDGATTPLEIFTALLTLMGLTIADFSDDYGFATQSSEFVSVRRYVSERTAIIDLITDLLFEMCFSLRVSTITGDDKGMYQAIRKDPSVYYDSTDGSTLDRYTDDDIIGMPTEDLDTGNLYCNQFLVSFNYLPRFGKYKFENIVVSDTASISDNKGVVIEETLELSWVSDMSGALATAERYLWYRKQLLNNFILTMDIWRGLRRMVGDVIEKATED